MFNISSKSQKQADDYLESIKKSHHVPEKDRSEIKLLKELYLSKKIFCSKYWKGTFREFVRFYKNHSFCFGCEKQFKPKAIPEQISEKIISKYVNYNR